MNCPRCGSAIADGLNFCTECGSPVGATASNQAVLTVCPLCGAQLDGGSFCPKCGTAIPVASGAVEPTQFAWGSADVAQPAAPQMQVVQPAVVVPVGVAPHAQQGKPQGVGKGVVLGIVVALALLLAAFGVYSLVNQGGSSESSKEVGSTMQEASEASSSSSGREKEASSAPAVRGKTPPGFSTATASSVSTADKMDDYRATSTIDGSDVTAWNTDGRTTGDARGQWIELQAAELQHVEGLRILPGFCKSQEVWSKNRRPRDITITFSDGSSVPATLADTFGEYQTIALSKAVDTTTIRITINSSWAPTFNGKTYDDCAISEITVY